MSKEKLISKVAIIYSVTGFIFAILFALYYRWPPLSFLSPNFYSVLLTWPYQAIGFIRDLLNYGLTGKPV